MEIVSPGPTTLVTTAVPLEAKIRSARSKTGLGAAPIAQRTWYTASAWAELLSARIRRRTSKSRSRGSSMPTGSARNTRPKRFPSRPAASGPRRFTGTTARTSRSPGSSPRRRREQRSAPARAAIRTSFTVEPVARPMVLNSPRSKGRDQAAVFSRAERPLERRRWVGGQREQPQQGGGARRREPAPDPRCAPACRGRRRRPPPPGGRG